MCVYSCTAVSHSVLTAVAERDLPRVVVKLVDERYTTREAKARIQMDGLPDQLDAMSARCLLERYIEDLGEGAIMAKACNFPIPSDLERFDYGLVKRHIEDMYYEEPSDLEKKKRLIKFRKEGGFQQQRRFGK